MTGWEIAGQAQFLEKFYGPNFESSRGWRRTQRARGRRGRLAEGRGLVSRSLRG